MHKPRILFRADGDSHIGLGHIMRCIALSEMLNTDFNCVFLVSKPSVALKSIIAPFGAMIELHSSTKTIEWSELGEILMETDIVVTDGYDFDTPYLKYIKRKVAKLVMIDDLAEGEFIADLVINHCNELIKTQYNKADTTKVLTGFKYLILRKEFLNVAKTQKSIDLIETAFICMGGADPTNLTLKILLSCNEATFIKELNIVIGAAYLGEDQLLAAASQLRSDLKLNIYKNINAAEMISVISKAQICICPASSIALEVCCIKSGLLTGVSFSNQKELHQQLMLDNCCVSIGDFNEVDIKGIADKLGDMSAASFVNQMMESQHQVIDGKSPERILNEFKLLLAC